MCGLGLDVVGIHSLSLAARYRAAACSTTLNQGLEKIQAARGKTSLLFSLSLLTGRKNFLLLPWLLATLFVAWTMMANLMKPRRIKKHKVATGLLRDKLYEQDFAGAISLRASKVLGPMSRYRVADILFHMKLVSRASRPGLTVGVLCILCNGLCTAQRFHTEDHEHMCRVGCPNEPDSLSHYNECPLLCDMFRSFCGQATVLPRRNNLLHDLITQVFVRSLQYGILVMGFIDAYVCAHHQHRRSIENSGNFGDCIKGRIRFMTAITPAFAHALPKPKARYRHLPNVRTTTRERGNDFKGWDIFSDEVVLALLMVKP